MRDALGMTASQLAARLGKSQSAVTRIEQREAEGTISLNTLREAADALGCELVYAIVPRQSLATTLKARAREKAAGDVSRLTHSMALEDQTPSPGARRKDLLQDRIAELLNGNRARLWDGK